MIYKISRKNNPRYYNIVTNETLKTSLSSLGFSSLPEYFQSDLWKTIKGKTLEKASNKCSSCGKKTQVVKLLDYHIDTLQGKAPLYIQCMCKKCQKVTNANRPHINKTLCPHCHMDRLTDDEKMINSWGTPNQKTVCRDCRIAAIDSAKIKDSDYSVEDYRLLPEHHKYDIKDFFFRKKGVT